MFVITSVYVYLPDGAVIPMCIQVVVVDENGNCPLSKVQKNFICDHCYGAFRSGYHLKRHILIHTGMSVDRCWYDRPCTIHLWHTCSSTLMQLASCVIKEFELNLVRLIVGEKPFACAICDMRFIQRYHLERHSLTHTGTPTSHQLRFIHNIQRYLIESQTLKTFQ